MYNTIQLEDSWKRILQEEFNKTYFEELVTFLRKEKLQGKSIYPSGNLIFNAFNQVPFHNVKVVLLGQDPYHNPGEAMGLSFSVPKQCKIPPSLKNIFKELQADIPDFVTPSHGDLTNWSAQGVFLLNAMLTVEHKKAGSHQKIGWQQFTDAVIQQLSTHRENLVFLLWGNFAKSKSVLIDSKKHLILSATHPSPLAGGAFFGCKHFSKTNAYLIQKNINPINWKLAD